MRYIDIVRRNIGDIDDPDLIYPNQIFALPKPDAANQVGRCVDCGGAL